MHEMMNYFKKNYGNFETPDNPRAFSGFEVIDKREKEAVIDIFDNGKSVLLAHGFDNIRKNRQLLKIISIWFINSLANVLPMILFAFFITYFLGGDDSRRQEVLFYYFLFSVLGVPFWTILSKKLGKTKTWSISLFFSALFFVGVLFWMSITLS